MYENSYTLATLDGLISNTYILGVVVALIFFGLSFLTSQMIAYQGGKNPKDPSKRRLWFFILAALGVTFFFLFNYAYVLGLVKGAPAQDKFRTAFSIASIVELVVYVAIGFVASKLMKKTKYGTIFP